MLGSDSSCVKDPCRVLESRQGGGLGGGTQSDEEWDEEWEMMRA